MMTLTQMRYFAAVCQWQNITKAAASLHVSQPTISVAMQTLETETGLNLFHREGRRLLLTHDGEHLLARVTHILDLTDQLEDEIGDLSHHRNHIRMAMPLQIGTFFLPRILGEFRAAHPEIVLDIIETGGIEALHMVEEEKLDIAVTNYETGFSQKLVYRKLFSCGCCFVTYPGHPLAARETVSVEDIGQEPLTLLDSKFFVYRLVNDAYAAIGQKPQVIHYSPYLHTVKNLVRQRTCSTFLAAPAVLSDDGLVAIPLAEDIRLNSGIVTRKGRQVYDDEKTLMQFLRKVVKEETTRKAAHGDSSAAEKK